MQPLKAAPSRLHWKTANSLAEKEKLANEDATVPVGPDVMVVTGGVVSGGGGGGGGPDGRRARRVAMLPPGSVPVAVRIPVGPAAIQHTTGSTSERLPQENT